MADGVTMTKDEKRKRPRREWRMLRRFGGSQSGIAAVEFALIGPILIIMIIGVIEGGRLFWFQSSLQHQVEEVARYAMTHYTREYYTLCDPDQDPAPASNCADSLLETVDSTAETRADTATVGWDPTVVEWSVTREDNTGTDLDYLLVEGDYTFTFVLGLIPALNMTLHAETRVPMVRFE